MQNLKPGCLIECKFFSAKVNELSTALFRLHEMESDRAGLLADAEFIATSNPNLKEPLQIINLEPTGKPLHLCLVQPAKCPHKNSRHASVWRHRSVNRLREDWVTNSMREALKRPFKIKEAYDAEQPDDQLPVGFEDKDDARPATAPAPSSGVQPLLPQHPKKQGGSAVMSRLKNKLDAAGKGPAGSGRDAAEEAPAGESGQAAAVDDGADELPDVPEEAKAKIAELRAKLAAFQKAKEKKESSKTKGNLLMQIAAKKRKSEDPGATDDEGDLLEDKEKKKKKDKKKKKKKKKSSSSSQDDSVSDSSEVSELFRDPSSRRSSLSSRLQRVAKKEPGKLLRKTLEVMWEQLQPGVPMKGGQRTPPIVMAYLRDQLKSKELKGRNLVELTTIGLAADHMLKGELEQAVELLLQRFKSVEAPATGSLPSEASRYLELIPPQTGSCLIDEEREEAIALQKSWKKHTGE